MPYAQPSFLPKSSLIKSTTLPPKDKYMEWHLCCAKINGFTFPASDLQNLITVKAYGKKFLSPANPELYLEQMFGKNWRIPNKKQFCWNKSSFNQSLH